MGFGLGSREEVHAGRYNCLRGSTAAEQLKATINRLSRES